MGILGQLVFWTVAITVVSWLIDHSKEKVLAILDDPCGHYGHDWVYDSALRYGGYRLVYCQREDCGEEERVPEGCLWVWDDEILSRDWSCVEFGIEGVCL